MIPFLLRFGFVYLKLEHLEFLNHGSVHLYWPEPMHVFSAPELKVALPENKHYAAVRSTQAGAPFRAITLQSCMLYSRIEEACIYMDLLYSLCL